MSEFAPLDVISMSRDDDMWPPLIVLLRDYRDPPGWITINTKTAQLERVFDFIAYRYRVIGRSCGTHAPQGTSSRMLSELLARAVW